MEESAKRKERLKAMRAGAGQPELVDGHSSSASPLHLLNFLAQPSSTTPGAEQLPPASRFDYYTDPMSAYSGNKRGVTHHPPDGFSSPVCGSSPMAHWRSPSTAGQGRHYMTPTSVPANHSLVSYSPHQGSYTTPSPAPRYDIWRSPVGMVGPYNSVDMCGSTSAGGVPVGSSRGIFVSPGFGRGVCPSADSGRGSLSANSGGGCRSANSGRGSSWRPRNQSPFSGRGSQGRRGSKELVSARENPWMFFNKPMVWDPWDKLEPVVGCLLKPQATQIIPDSLKSWLPASIREKRVKVMETTPASHSQGSLAEYIALAFEEAVNDETA